MNKLRIRKYLKFENKNYNNIGQKLFNIGTLFFPWAVPFGIAFLFGALLISLFKNAREFFKDKTNFLIIIASLLMVIAVFKQSFDISKSNFLDFDTQIYLGLFNWIPLFFTFWGFQYYLKSSIQRKIFARNLLIGSIPVLISCVGQYWFKWETQIIFAKGLIVWFQKPLEDNSGISGLFSNPNYTGFWLTTIWPFALFFLSMSKRNLLRVTNFILVLTIFYLTTLTGSRNAFLGIIISTSLLFKIKVFLLIFSFIILILVLNNIINQGTLLIFEPFLPKQLLSKITTNFNLSFLEFQRIEIWEKTIDFISKKPFLGWGASTFPIVYTFFQGISDAQHTHNIFLQLSYDYGLIVSIIIAFIIFNLLFKVLRKYFKDEKEIYIFDKFWIVSAIVAISFHQLDFPYFDGRISILFWTLLAGLKSILNDKKNQII